MPRFRFRLQALVEVAERDKRQAIATLGKTREALAAAQKEEETRQLELRASHEEEGRAMSRLTETERESIQSGRDYSGIIEQPRAALSATKAAVSRVERALAAAQRALSAARSAESDALRAFRAASEKIESLDQIRLQDLADYRRAIERRQMLELNEVGAAMHYLNQLDESEYERTLGGSAS